MRLFPTKPVGPPWIICWRLYEERCSYRKGGSHESEAVAGWNSDWELPHLPFVQILFKWGAATIEEIWIRLWAHWWDPGGKCCLLPTVALCQKSDDFGCLSMTALSWVTLVKNIIWTAAGLYPRFPS